MSSAIHLLCVSILQGAQVVRKIASVDKVYDYFSEIYSRLDDLSNTNTANMDAKDVME